MPDAVSCNSKDSPASLCHSATLQIHHICLPSAAGTAGQKELLQPVSGGIENTSGGIPRELVPTDSFVGSTQVLESRFVEFLFSVIRSASFSILEKTGSSSILASNSFVELIKSYLCDNLYKSLTLDTLCKKFSVSKSNLCKKWKEHSEIGIIDYFISLKVNEARRLLEEGKISVTQIADMLGYSTIHHFSHSFKKFTGISPSEYKKLMKKD